MSMYCVAKSAQITVPEHATAEHMWIHIATKQTPKQNVTDCRNIARSVFTANAANESHEIGSCHVIDSMEIKLNQIDFSQNDYGSEDELFLVLFFCFLFLFYTNRSRHALMPDKKDDTGAPI